MSDTIRISKRLRNMMDKYKNYRIKEYERLNTDKGYEGFFDRDIEEFRNMSDIELLEKALFEINYLKEKEQG